MSHEVSKEEVVSMENRQAFQVPGRLLRGKA
ncbi:hypothetical protein SRABI96_03315 [Peribacillus sp. Bi96]|nr:hypothetical protein SRABI96_03315 [Peribacillus sp. Bi96]